MKALPVDPRHERAPRGPEPEPLGAVLRDVKRALRRHKSGEPADPIEADSLLQRWADAEENTRASR